MVNIATMRAFVRLRDVLAAHQDLAHRMAELERDQKKHAKQVAQVFEYIQKLLQPPQQSRRKRVGFLAQGKSEDV